MVAEVSTSAAATVAETAAKAPTSLVQHGDDDTTRAAIEAVEADERARAEALSADIEAAAANEVPPTTADTTKAQRPENVPEKFWDADTGTIRTEDLLKSYTELEKSRGAPPKVEGEAAATETATEAEAKETVEKAGLSFDKFYTEYAAKGELAPESRKELNDKGITDELIDAYIDGQKARAERQAATIETEIKGTVGGADEYRKMAEWAQKNLSVEDIAEFDGNVNGTDPKVAKLAVKALHAQYRASTGERLPELVEPKARSGGGDAYSSQAEINKDIADPRYAKDPFFRAQVEAKIDRSGGNF